MIEVHMVSWSLYLFRIKAWFNLQIDACISFVDPDAEVLKPNAKLLEAIEELTWVAEHDFDGGG